jgi:glycosyltransferase involved in cell wall biosynthesis
MKILILVAQHGFSLVNQARSLSKGLSKIEIENTLVRIDESFDPGIIQEYSPDIVLGIGPWDSYHELVEIPLSLGFKSIPWTFNHFRFDKLVKEYNTLELTLTISAFCKGIFVRDGIDSKSVEILQEAVDSDFWRPMALPEVLKFAQTISIADPELSLPMKFDLRKLKEGNVPIIFTTGGDATGKGALEIIQALGKLSKKVGKKWLYLVKTWPSPGSFEFSSKELSLAESLGIYENIRYIVGEFSEDFLKGLMNLCDIYVATSKVEGFGLPLVEAAMCEKPVVGLSGTATEEIIVDGITGYVCKSRNDNGVRLADIDDLSNILERLISDKNLREDLGKKGRQEAILKYSPEVVAKRLIEIINSRLRQ